MALQRLSLLAMTLPLAASFQNTSPFFLLSTNQIPVSSLDSIPLQSGSSVLSSTKDVLSTCPSDTYILISQPGTSPLDFTDGDATPHLRKLLQKDTDRVRSSATIPNVLGSVDVNELAQWLSQKCHARIDDIDVNAYISPSQSELPRVIKAEFPMLPVDEFRAGKLSSYDSFLHSLLSTFENQSLTLLYTTTPPPASYVPSQENLSPTYEMDDPFASVLHEDLRRDVSAHDSEGTLPEGGLFERYQFFSPAIFMTLIVSILLLLVLYIAISALSGLQVSYFAFSKEMGPSGYKKIQ
ncbi:BIG1-domain-containing protein [Eremomyces bilateralis CBS 781.70]|uniref:Protein BIG1 n=1 Tax=Eremomyces bilateralis CBS 781.70 TaxID=1392243 RepID=A0A6G1GD87_9PEZI|nr:BIG1-domain-containing protein [Eremomyces bilateralis CBS 781.70]KAF1815993.1 BIG1-domain-containing protein [Eremomyces bilateralis CBS 781.70]